MIALNVFAEQGCQGVAKKQVIIIWKIVTKEESLSTLCSMARNVMFQITLSAVFNSLMKLNSSFHCFYLKHLLEVDYDFVDTKGTNQNICLFKYSLQRYTKPKLADEISASVDHHLDFNGSLQKTITITINDAESTRNIVRMNHCPIKG